MRSPECASQNVCEPPLSILIFIAMQIYVFPFFPRDSTPSLELRWESVHTILSVKKKGDHMLENLDGGKLMVVIKIVTDIFLGVS